MLGHLTGMSWRDDIRSSTYLHQRDAQAVQRVDQLVAFVVYYARCLLLQT